MTTPGDPPPPGGLIDTGTYCEATRPAVANTGSVLAELDDLAAGGSEKTATKVADTVKHHRGDGP